MKILIIRPFPEKINIDSYNVQEIGLAKALSQKGYECGIVFYEPGPKCSEQVIHVEGGKDIHVFWRKGISVLKNGVFFGLSELIEKYDVIQVHEYDQFYSWYLYSFCKKPVVVYHGPYYNEFNKRYNCKTVFFDKLFLNKKNTKKSTIITKSELASSYLKAKGFANVKTIGVGLDSDKLVRKEPSSEVINVIESVKNNPSFLYVGKIEERRNILFLLDVFARVNKMHSNSKLVMVGKGSGEYVQKVKDKIASLGIEDSVIWIEKMAQNQLSHLYSTCRYFLFTTEYDIFGMVLLEAMYYGMTVFSTVNGGSSTLIKPNENGFVFDEFDVDTWTNKINEILSDSDSGIGLKAKETIHSKYLWSSLADEFIRTYKECVER